MKMELEGMLMEDVPLDNDSNRQIERPLLGAF